MPGEFSSSRTASSVEGLQEFWTQQLQLPAPKARDPGECFLIGRSRSYDFQDLRIGKEDPSLQLQPLSFGRPEVPDPGSHGLLSSCRSSKTVAGRAWVGLEGALRERVDATKLTQESRPVLPGQVR